MDWGVEGFQKLQIKEKKALDLELTTQQQFYTKARDCRTIWYNEQHKVNNNNLYH